MPRIKAADALQRIAPHHVLKAIEYIDKHGVPKRRNSTRFSLRHNGRLYPPKYLLAIACTHAIRQTLSPEEHSGGEHDSNKRLRELGFTDLIRQPSNQPEH